MRKIKFRAWLNGKYFYSDDVTFCFRGNHIFFFDSYGDRYDVDPNSIDQFIATDINGVDIYENDPVKVVKYYDDEEGYISVGDRYANNSHSASFEDYKEILDGAIIKGE